MIYYNLLLAGLFALLLAVGYVYFLLTGKARSQQAQASAVTVVQT